MADQGELTFILRMQDQASQTLASFNSSVSGLTSTIREQMAAMNQLTATLKGHEAGTHAAAAAIHEHAAAHEHAGESAKKHAAEELTVGRALERVAAQAKEAAEALIGIWASNEMARSTVEAAEDTERAIMAIGRASGLAREEVVELHEGLANLSMKNGNATIEQMDQMAGAAARMGASKEQMLVFADTLSKITNAGNFQHVTQGMSQILQATGEGAEGVEKFGDALAAMEKHSLHGIEGLLPVMERLAGQAGELGLSSSHIAAYAETFEKLGGRPEMAVMAFERTVVQLKETAALGGRQLRDLAEQTGMTAAEFKKMTATRPEEAFQKLLQVVHELQEQGKDPANFLSRLGIGNEQAGAIENMAKHIKELKANLNEVDNSGGEAGKMADQTKLEFDRALNEMTTAWTEFKAYVGGDVMVAATAGFKAAGAAIEEVTGFLKALSPEMRILVEGLVIGTPAVLGLTKIIGAVLEVAASALTTLTMVGTKIVGSAAATGAGVNAAEEAMVVTSAANWARMVAGPVAAAFAVYEASKAIAGFINQVNVIHAGGASYGDIMSADLTGSAAGKAELLKRMQGELDERRKNGTETEQDKLIDARSASNAQTAKDRDESGVDRAPADRHERDDSVKETIKARDELNEKVRASLLTLDAYSQKLEALDKKQADLDTARKTVAEGGRSDFTEHQLALMQQRINAEKMLADPLAAQTRAMGDQAAKAQAVTKAQKDQLETALAIRKLEEDGVLDATTPNDAAHTKVRAEHAEASGAEAGAAYDKQLLTLRNQLQAAQAVTAADRQRVEVNQQIDQLYRDGVIRSSEQEQHLREQLVLGKQITSDLALQKELRPQGAALADYTEKLKFLGDQLARNQINQAQYNAAAAQLARSTEAARDPMSAIATAAEHEAQQTAITGKYRDADVKALQAKFDLQSKGVDVTDKEASALQALARAQQDLQKAQTEGISGFANTVPDIDAQLGQVANDFSGSLAGGIENALARKRGAFAEVGAALGKSMLKMGVDGILHSGANLLGLGDTSKQQQAVKDAAKHVGDFGKKESESALRDYQAIQANVVNLTASQINGAPANGAPGSATPSDASTAAPGQPAAQAAPSAAAAPSLPSPSSMLPSAPPSVAASVAPALVEANTVARGGGTPNLAAPATSGFSFQAPGLGQAFTKLGDALGMTPKHIPVTNAAHPGQAAGTALTGPPVAPTPTNNSAFGDLGAAKQAFGARPGMASQSAFVNDAYQKALGSGMTDEQARITAAQASIESGNGHAAPGNNFFGMKSGTNWQGESQRLWTHENLNGQNVRIQDNFRKYGSYDESSQDHLSMLKRNWPDAANAKNDDEAIAGLDHGRYGKYATGDANNPNAYGDAIRARTALIKPSNDNAMAEALKKHAEMAQTPAIAGSSQQSALGGASDAAKKAQEAWQQSQKQLADTMKQTSQATQGSLTGLSSGISNVGKTAAEGVPDMSQFGSSIQGMLSKLGSGGGGGGGGGLGGLGGLFGGSGGGGDFATSFADVAAFHSGGVVGSTFGTMLSRNVSPSLFAGAPRFHDGLTGDEFPAILQKGERVLTQNQDSRATHAMSKMADMIANSNVARGGGVKADNARPSSGRSVVMNIQTKDANSFRYSGSQIMAQTHASMARASAHHN